MVQEHIYIYSSSRGQEVQQEGGRVPHFVRIYTAKLELLLLFAAEQVQRV